MTEPVHKWISLDDLRSAALNYMRVQHGLPPKDDQEARDAWHQKLGLLTVFVTELWDNWPRGGDNG